MTMTKFSRINKQREEITMRVLEDMEKGGNEWKKPWVEASPLPPHNPVSGTQYSGRNFLYTYVYGMMRGSSLSTRKTACSRQSTIRLTTAGPKASRAGNWPSRTFQASSSIFSKTIPRGILSNLQHRKAFARMTIAQPSICPKKPLPPVRHRLDCLIRLVRSPARAMKAPSATADQRTEV